MRLQERFRQGGLESPEPLPTDSATDHDRPRETPSYCPAPRSTMLQNAGNQALILELTTVTHHGTQLSHPAHTARHSSWLPEGGTSESARRGARRCLQRAPAMRGIRRSRRALCRRASVQNAPDPAVSRLIHPITSPRYGTCGGAVPARFCHIFQSLQFMAASLRQEL